MYEKKKEKKIQGEFNVELLSKEMKKRKKKGEKRFRNGDFCRRRYAMRCRF
jgi:hypothetical protein